MRYIETRHHTRNLPIVSQTIEIVDDQAWIDVNDDGQIVGFEIDDNLNDAAVLVAVADWVELTP